MSRSEAVRLALSSLNAPPESDLGTGIQETLEQSYPNDSVFLVIGSKLMSIDDYRLFAITAKAIYASTASRGAFPDVEPTAMLLVRSNCN